MLHVASVEPEKEQSHQIKVNGTDSTLTVKYGDHSSALRKVVTALKEVNPDLVLMVCSAKVEVS